VNIDLTMLNLIDQIIKALYYIIHFDSHIMLPISILLVGWNLKYEIRLILIVSTGSKIYIHLQ